MVTFLATYDFAETDPDPHATFLAQALKHGWNYFVETDGGRWYRLPNTTLAGSFSDRDEAGTSLKATRAATERELGATVTMLKWIVVEFNGALLGSNDIRDR